MEALVFEPRPQRMRNELLTTTLDKRGSNNFGNSNFYKSQ